MEITNNIECPKCKYAFDISAVLIKRVKESYDQDFNVRNADFEKKWKTKLELADKTISESKKREQAINDIISEAVDKKLKTEKVVLTKKIRSELNKETSEQMAVYEIQLKEKTKALIEFNKLKAQLERVEREKNELRSQIELEMEKRFTSELALASQKTKDEIEKNALFKVQEKDLLINSLKDQLNIAQRKMEQGSMQLQGEAQEKAIESYLTTAFPADQIDEIKKGVKGGDCIHHVINSTGVDCGSIYYESKRSNKEFQIGWIEKFKQDMRNKKSTFGVIVTETFPKDMSKMGFKNGIIICSWLEFQGLCQVLRQMVLMLYQTKLSQENTGDKMQLLYQYLVGTEFHGHLEAIVEAFVQMSEDLGKEKRSLESLWKQREKQIQKVLVNSTNLYATIKGIAGSAVVAIKQLEMPLEGDSNLSDK